jgi:hypothetical protein
MNHAAADFGLSSIDAGMDTGIIADRVISAVREKRLHAPVF